MFRAFVLVITLACVSCTSNKDSTYPDTPLDITSYRDSKCWLGSGNVLQSFVILTNANKGRWPLFVSDRCILIHRKKDFRRSILSFPSAFPVDGDGGVAQNASMTDFEILSNTADHLPKVDGSSEVFYITAEVERMRGQVDGVYHISRVKSLDKIGVGVEEFLNLDISERRALH